MQHQLNINRLMQKKAFSLLELTIAITLIALLTAIISAGRNIKHNSNLAAIMSEVTRIKGAVNGFYSEFQQLPGDFNNANLSWAGVNGNGDGKIAWNNVEKNYFADLAASYYLSTYNPAHNSLADFYRTIDVFDKANNSFYLVAGDNNADYLSNAHLPNNTNATRADNYIFYAKIYLNGSNYENFGASLTPNDAYKLDLKYDDGNPIYGQIISQNGYNATENNTNYNDYVICNISTKYNLNIDYTACRIAFKLNVGSY